MEPTRRKLLQIIAATVPSMTLVRQAGANVFTDLELDLTPTCGDHDSLTPEQTSGPFYSPNAPERWDLSSDASEGVPFVLAGLVLDQRCRPVRDVIVELWHADQKGEYDNKGFRLRAYQRTDHLGRWAFLTVRTQHYSFRTAHYHFRVQRPDGSFLTTQLYFPDHPRNGSDHLFDPRLVMQVEVDNGENLPVGRFEFVV